MFPGSLFFPGAARLFNNRFFKPSFQFGSLLIDYREVFHISTLEALLVPAVIISIEIQVTAALGATSACFLS